MRVLVTGAYGGLASSVITCLTKNSKYEVVTTGRGTSNTANYVRCDLSDRTALHAMVERVRPQLILHLAGSFQNDFASDVVVNALSAGWIAEALHSCSINARLVLVGSAAEYGAVTPKENPVAETHALCPVSVYGLTKVLQTQIGTYYATARGVDLVIARLFNVFGPGLSDRLFVGSAERQIQRFRRGEAQHLVFGNLDSERDYISMEEFVRQLFLLAERGAHGSVYNLGSGKPTRMRDLLHRMLNEAGVSNAPIIERSVDGRAAVIDLPCIYADVSQLRSLETR